MLFHEDDGVALFADPLDGLEDDVDQVPDPARAGWKEVSEIVGSFVGTRAQVRLGAVHRSSRLIT
jgi:hypothetical protein